MLNYVRLAKLASAGSRVQLQSQDSLPASEHFLWPCPFPRVRPFLLRIMSL
jgi:hypothetical protein